MQFSFNICRNRKHVVCCILTHPQHSCVCINGCLSGILKRCETAWRAGPVPVPLQQEKGELGEQISSNPALKTEPLTTRAQQ